MPDRVLSPFAHPLPAPAEEPRAWFHIGSVRAEVVGDQGDGEKKPERKTADVYVFDAIGGWGGTTATSFVRDVAALDVDHIDLHLNSPGGAAMDGVAIANVLRQHRADVTVWVDGMAASAASVIAMAGDEIVMGIGSQLMVHDASGIAMGPASEMRKAADMLDSTSNAYASAYAQKAGGTAAEWRAVMVEETWYTGEEAVAAKLADRVATPADNGRSSGEQVVPGDAMSGFWDMWDQLAPAARHMDTVRALYAHAGRADAPPPQLPARAGKLAAGVISADITIKGKLPGPRIDITSKTPAATASGSTHEERSAPVPFTDEHLASLRTTLGLAADADEDRIVATVAEVMTEFVKADPPTGSAPLPQGAVVVDGGALEQLKRDAALGAQARAEQVQARREATVDAAIAAGKVLARSRAAWLQNLAVDEEGTTAALAGLDPIVPLAEVGHDTQPAAQEDLGWFDTPTNRTEG